MYYPIGDLIGRFLKFENNRGIPYYAWEEVDAFLFHSNQIWGPESNHGSLCMKTVINGKSNFENGGVWKRQNDGTIIILAKDSKQGFCCKQCDEGYEIYWAATDDLLLAILISENPILENSKSN